VIVSKRMKNGVLFTVVNLEGNPRDLEKGPVKLKQLIPDDSLGQSRR
jgi:hypothetical protein